jgi:hypothetical protein
MLAILLSFGTGMLSGGIQHYPDNPAYGSILLSLGLILTFISLSYKDFADVITKKIIGLMVIISLTMYLSLNFIGHNFIGSSSDDGHHGTAETLRSD